MTRQHQFLDMAIRKVGNRYLATMLIAKRIRQLQHGAAPFVPREEGESTFTVAVREIAEGHVTLSDEAPEASLTSDIQSLVHNGTPDIITPQSVTDSQA